ncbi:MAG TPA: thioesterase family protein [Holophagaceae bacterium]|nr:thioesterase family protein [Holophagaceae bacterium]
MTVPLRADVILEIPFHDVDVMGIVWHGHYVKYLEIARTALMRKAGLDLAEMDATGCGWPIVTCELKYLKPLRYGQKVRVEAELLEYEQRLKVAYVLRDLDTGTRHTKATTVQIAVEVATGEVRYETPAPMVAAFERARG